MIRAYILFFYLCFGVVGVSAQELVYPLSSDRAYQIMERLAIKGVLSVTSAKPYTRGQVLATAPLWDSLSRSKGLSDDILYLKKDNQIWQASEGLPPQYKWLKRPILRYFYGQEAYLGQVRAGNFIITLNPITSFSMGRDKYVSDSRLFFNQRGVEVTGSIDKRL